jgi:hypothetical protein
MCGYLSFFRYKPGLYAVLSELPCDTQSIHFPLGDNQARKTKKASAAESTRGIKKILKMYTVGNR